MINNNTHELNLEQLGWNDAHDKAFKALEVSGAPARVVLDHGQKYRVVTSTGEKWMNRPHHIDFQIAVGDWVVVENTEGSEEVHFKGLIPRRTKFSRAAAGIEVKEQIVAANVDIVFLIQSLNHDFNVRRLERYLIAAWESGATPVIVLTKADLCEDVSSKIRSVHEVAMGVDVFAVSNLTGEGLDAIRPFFKEGVTIALLGSSGVGKSTLVNALLGSELLKTGTIREYDSKGRHTTTHRELVVLPGGGVILDTPGMRSLSLWESEVGMDKMFGEIETLLTQCRFSDCTHKNEPGCAIVSGLRKGTIDLKRWESWKKLQKELKHLESKRRQKTRELTKRNTKDSKKYDKNAENSY